ncbi:MAG TPA: glycosyltransferase family 4 protein [Anaerolineae bacterium]
MRIAQVAGEYPPLQGGLGDFTRELSRALAAAGHEVHVLTKMSAGLEPREQIDGIDIQRLDPRWGWHSLRQVDQFIIANHPDIVNLQYQAAAYNMHPAINLLPRIIRRVPVVVTFHDLRVPYLFSKAGPFRRKAISELAGSAASVIVTNEEDRATLAQAGVADVNLIPIGSNIIPQNKVPFDRQAWLQARGYPSSQFIVGYFGFMNVSKGGAVLMRAFAQLRAQGVDANLLLIGGLTGESDITNLAYARDVMNLAVQLGISEHVLQTGYLTNHDVSDALAACDCMALPYQDGASFRRGTLMAALAHGRAIVTTRPRLPLPELVDGENAMLVPPDDAEQLADAVRRTLNDIALRQRLESGSLALSARFGWGEIAAKTLQVYAKRLR